jgi:hypothetical protein
MPKPTISIFNGDKGLGRVYKESNEIITKFTEVNVPFTTTTGRTSWNIFGKTRIIIIQGAHDGTGFDGITQEQKLGDFIYEIESWVNAMVQTSKIFTDSFDTSYSVDCVDWMWVRSNTDPGRILYTLMLKED